MKIGISSVNKYDANLVDNAVVDVLTQVDIDSLIAPQSNVFVKVNLVRDMSPDKCGTTHPTVVEAVCRYLIERLHCDVTVGDSSGGQYTKGYMENVYRVTQMNIATERSGAKLNSDFDFTNVDINGLRLKKLDITNSFLKADCVINIGKLKTHSFTGYSGAIKNLYGLIPGLVKVEVHSMFPNINEFCECLIDLERFSRPKIVLHMLDAVIGMEGAGPTNGIPRKLGKIMACENPYLLDIAGLSLFCDPKIQPLIKKAIEVGELPQDFSTLGYDFDAMYEKQNDNFKVVKIVESNTFMNMPRWLKKLAKQHLTQKAIINRKVCKGCRKCEKHCPANAIMMISGKAYINQYKCLRCYCCQELCAYDAVLLHKPLLLKTVRLFSRTKNKRK